LTNKVGPPSGWNFQIARRRPVSLRISPLGSRRSYAIAGRAEESQDPASGRSRQLQPMFKTTCFSFILDEDC